MDTTPSPAINKKIIRVDTRYRHRAQDISSEKRSTSEKQTQQNSQQAVAIKKEEEDQAAQADRLHNDRGEPLLIREQNGRAVMGRAHRIFHRRAAQEAPAVLTVNVNVIETVDTDGNVIAQQTLPPGVPPPVPTVALPVVPSVPAFPSDLTVPAYPWPSGVPTVIEAAAPSSPAVESPPPALTTPAPEATNVPATAPIFPSNSTISSTILSSSLSSISLSSVNSSSSSSSSSASLSSSLSSSRTSSVSQTASSSSGYATSTAYGGGGGIVNTAVPPASTNSAAAAGTSDSKGPLDTPGVVGSVVGSLAGAALILAIILLLIKRHKRKQRGGALQLQDEASERDQVMSQPRNPTRNSLVPAYFLNRFSGASRSTADTSTTGGGERGFQRISGRKLPSAFSEGMTSEQFASSRGEGALSGSSFYRDEKGFYGGPGFSKEFSKEIGESSMPQNGQTQERFMPSPARTPVIRHPDDSAPFTLSPPQTPNPDPPRGTLGRSHPSHDGSRSSRFTENV